MLQVNILNVPNYYSSYFLLGFHRVAKLRYTPQKEFSHLNNKPFLVLEVMGKVLVIENDDPIGVDKKSYELCDLYFATNKLKSHEEYNWLKVRSIFPHYSIDFAWNYFMLFKSAAGDIGIKELFRQWYILYRRPGFVNYPRKSLEGNYVFFAGSIWKKEPWANQVRAAFIQACQANPNIQFEGGMNPRNDGDLCGLPPSVMDKRYTPEEFAQKSAKSVIGFSNPAVLDAVSWRLAEYWNYGCFVIGFPFKIDLPISPEHGNHMHYIQDVAEFSEVITFAMKNPEYRKKVSQGGKNYFETYCLPEKQAELILNSL